MTNEEFEGYPFLVIAGVAIKSAEDLLTAYWTVSHRPEFVEPLLTQPLRRCCRCGTDIGNKDSVAWDSVQALTVDGVLAGVARLYHCRDCPPESLLKELKATGSWPATTPDWKFSQGEDPDGPR